MNFLEYLAQSAKKPKKRCGRAGKEWSPPYDPEHFRKALERGYPAGEVSTRKIRREWAKFKTALDLSKTIDLIPGFEISGNGDLKVIRWKAQNGEMLVSG